MNFSIKKSDGKKFSILSGDKNPIHLNEMVGYNSIFGEIICHGALLVIIFFIKANLKKKLIEKKFYCLDIVFFKPAKYNLPITIKKNNYQYELSQEGEIICKLQILFKNIKSKKIFFKKKFNFGSIKKNPYRGIDLNLYYALCQLSNHVGMIYPGYNSLIRRIKINKTNSLNIKKGIIESTNPNKISLIKNRLITPFYEIFYESLKRPTYDKGKITINKKLQSSALKITDNILIIGASSGLGYELLNILKNNKKIKIFATYKNNKINIKKKNIFTRKIDLNNDLKKINKIIRDSFPIRVYYFATPKIYFAKILSQKINKDYENFYVNFPIKIFKNNEKYIKYFFYPSSEFIKFNSNSTYSKYKLLGEKKFLKKKLKNNNIFLFRLPALYSKQSISLINSKPQTLSNFLIKNSNFKNILL